MWYDIFDVVIFSLCYDVDIWMVYYFFEYLCVVVFGYELEFVCEVVVVLVCVGWYVWGYGFVEFGWIEVLLFVGVVVEEFFVEFVVYDGDYYIFWCFDFVDGFGVFGKLVL